MKAKWIKRESKRPSFYAEVPLLVLDAHLLYEGNRPWYWSVCDSTDLNREVSSGVACTQEKAQMAAEAAAEALTL